MLPRVALSRQFWQCVHLLTSCMWEWCGMPGWGLKLPPVPSKPGVAWVWKHSLFGQQKALTALMGMAPEKDHLSPICILAPPDSASASCCVNGHRGTGWGPPLGFAPDPRMSPRSRHQSEGFGPSCFLQMWLYRAWRQPGQWQAETLRTFHWNKMHLIRAMENGKPGSGERECALSCKTNKQKMWLWEASKKNEMTWRLDLKIGTEGNLISPVNDSPSAVLMPAEQTKITS